MKPKPKKPEELRCLKCAKSERAGFSYLCHACYQLAKKSGWSWPAKNLAESEKG